MRNNIAKRAAAIGWPILVTALILLGWEINWFYASLFQGIADFPIFSARMSYLPIPLGGALTVLFVIERFLTQKFFQEPDPETVSQTSTE